MGETSDSMIDCLVLAKVLWDITYRDCIVTLDC